MPKVLSPLLVEAPLTSNVITTILPSGDTTGATDTASINAVLSAGGIVRLAQANGLDMSGIPYYTNAPLVPTTGSGIIGAVPWSAVDADSYGAGSGHAGGSTIHPVSSFSGTSVINMTNATGTQYYGVTLENFTLECWSLTGSTIEGIHIEGAWGAGFIRGVCVDIPPSDCLHFETNTTSSFNPDDWTVEDCKFSASAHGYGVYSDNLPDCWFTDCESSENDLDNWCLLYSANTSMTRCKGENSVAGAGFHFGGQGGTGRALNLNGCTSHDNYLGGYLFDNTAAGSGGVYLLSNCVDIIDTGAPGISTTAAGYYSNGCPNLVMLSNCYAFGAKYGGQQAGTTGGMTFTGCYLSGTTAAVHDDGSGTNRLINIMPAGTNNVTLSSDGTITSPGAMWFTPSSGHSASLNMLDQTSGTTFALMPEIVNAPSGVPAFGGFGSAWVVAGATSGTAASIFQVSNSSGTQELRIQDNGVVETVHNTLDDGSGNASTAGVQAHVGGTDTSGGATASTPSLSTTVAAQLNTTRDVMLYCNITTAATFALSIGSTSSVTTAVVASHTAAIGLISVRIPKAWYVKATFTSADVTFTQVTC